MRLGKRKKKGWDQTFAASEGGDVSWLGPDVVDDGPLKPGNHDVGTFLVDGVQHVIGSRWRGEPGL